MKKLILGCDQLGGEGWGSYDINDTIYLCEKALEIGFDGFDTSDIYGLGSSEIRLGDIISKTLKRNTSLITKGGIRWKMSKGKDRAETWKDSSRPYIKEAIKMSIERLKVEQIHTYLLHWHDNKTPIEETIEELKEAKKKGIIKNIGISNPKEEWLNDSQILESIDHIQVPSNALVEYKFPESFSKNKKKYGITVSCYGVLAHGMLLNKFTRGNVYPKTDRRSRHPIFKSEEIALKLDKIRQACATLSISVQHYAISHAAAQENIDYIIIGAKSIRQAEESIKLFANPIDSKLTKVQ